MFSSPNHNLSGEERRLWQNKVSALLGPSERTPAKPRDASGERPLERRRRRQLAPGRSRRAAGVASGPLRRFGAPALRRGREALSDSQRLMFGPARSHVCAALPNTSITISPLFCIRPKRRLTVSPPVWGCGKVTSQSDTEGDKTAPFLPCAASRARAPTSDCSTFKCRPGPRRRGRPREPREQLWMYALCYFATRRSVWCEAARKKN